MNLQDIGCGPYSAYLRYQAKVNRDRGFESAAFRCDIMAMEQEEKEKVESIRTLDLNKRSMYQ